MPFTFLQQTWIKWEKHVKSINPAKSLGKIRLKHIIKNKWLWRHEKLSSLCLSKKFHYYSRQTHLVEKFTSISKYLFQTKAAQRCNRKSSNSLHPSNVRRAWIQSPHHFIHKIWQLNLFINKNHDCCKVRYLQGTQFMFQDCLHGHIKQLQFKPRNIHQRSHAKTQNIHNGLLTPKKHNEQNQYSARI